MTGVIAGGRQGAGMLHYACLSGREFSMDIRRTRILSGLAETIIILAAVFLLLDALLGFTASPGIRLVRAQAASQAIDSTDLSASCAGGFADEQTVGGVTRVAAHGMPFNAYQVTLTNIGITDFTIYSMNVDLVNSRGQVFAQHHSVLGGGAGITLKPGESRQVVEAYGIGHPVASCEVVSWQS